MAREFRLPDLGSGLKEGRIVTWRVAVGDTVTTDDVLCDLETEKAVIEIPVPYDGVVASLAVEEGGDIAVGDVLATIATGADAEVPSGASARRSDDKASLPSGAASGASARPADDNASHPSAPASGSAASPSAEASPPSEVASGASARRSDDQASHPPAAASGSAASSPAEASPPSEVASGLRPRRSEDRVGAAASSTGARLRVAPVARKIAREQGLDLATVTGTGTCGRITRADVERELADSSNEPSANSVPAPQVAGGRREKISVLRKTIAAHMEKSWREIPHVFTRIEVDASRFLEARSALSEQLGQKIPIEAMLIKAALPALQKFPHFNAAFEGDAINFYDRYDIGVAIDTADGLIVPVVQGADELTLTGVVARLTDLVERTLARKATPDELTGATFTVNNIGALGHLIGTSIIPHGTTAILSAGRARKKPVALDDEVVIRPVMEVTLSFDHRAIDGGLAQSFMQQVRENLEQPVRYLAG